MVIRPHQSSLVSVANGYTLWSTGLELELRDRAGLDMRVPSFKSRDLVYNNTTLFSFMF